MRRGEEHIVRTCMYNSLSGRPSEERNILYVLVCVIGVKMMIVNTEENFGK